MPPRSAADILHDLFCRFLHRPGFLSHLRSLKGYDEPEILPYSTRRNCLIGADAGHMLTLFDTASCTNVVRVSARTFSITRATTLPLRLTAPTTGVLPEPMTPVPPPFPRLSLCLFLARPPTKGSSTSTMPMSF